MHAVLTWGVELVLMDIGGRGSNAYARSSSSPRRIAGLKHAAERRFIVHGASKLRRYVTLTDSVPLAGRPPAGTVRLGKAPDGRRSVML
jgi:hypothetical protein